MDDDGKDKKAPKSSLDPITLLVLRLAYTVVLDEEFELGCLVVREAPKLEATSPHRNRTGN